MFLVFFASGCQSPQIVTRTITRVETVTVTVPVDTDLDAGRYEAPLVELAELTGLGGAIGPGGSTASPRMHTSELRYRAGAPLTYGARPAELASCSNSFTLYAVDNPSRPSVLAQGWTFDQRDTDLNGDGVLEEGVDEIHSGTRRPGCHHLVFDEVDPDFVWITNHGSDVTGDSFLTGIDLSEVPYVEGEPYAVDPHTLAMQYEAGVTFEGIDYEVGLLYVARHTHGLGVYQRRPYTGQLERVSEHTGSLQNSFAVLVSGTTAYVADGASGVVVLDVSDPQAITELGAVAIPGTSTDLALDGRWLYVAAGSGGFSVVDVSTPSAPAVVSTVSGSGTVVAVEHDAGRLFVGAWTDARVYDVSDPTAPRFIGAVREEEAVDFGDDDSLRPESADRVLAIEGAGDVLFDGLWTTPRTYEVHPERTAPYLVLPETVQQLTIPGDLAPGESGSVALEIRNDGNEPLTVEDVWASGPAFRVSPSQLTVAPGTSATVQITFTASPVAAGSRESAGTSAALPEETSTFYVRTDDPTQPLRAGYVIGNPAGLAVGDRFPETLATLADGTTWSYGADAAGAPTLVSYWATFCPVCAAELPDLETAFWVPYREEGLRVVALNPDDDEALDPQRVWDFAAAMGVTFPVAIDEGSTYDELQATTGGASPYPVDLLVDRAGFIRYVAREYDPDAMRPLVEALLAEQR